MHGRTYRFGQQAVFPLGFGLGYSRIAYESVRCPHATIVDGHNHFTVNPSLVDYCGGSAREGVEVDLGAIELKVWVRNRGEHDQVETVQCYREFTDGESSFGDTRKYNLCGYSKVTVPAGQSCEVTVRIPIRELRLFDQSGAAWVPTQMPIAFAITDWAPLPTNGIPTRSPNTLDITVMLQPHS